MYSKQSIVASESLNLLNEFETQLLYNSSLISKSLPIAKHQTLPRTLEGKPFHQRSRHLFVRHLIKINIQYRIKEHALYLNIYYILCQLGIISWVHICVTFANRSSFFNFCLKCSLCFFAFSDSVRFKVLF